MLLESYTATLQYKGRRHSLSLHWSGVYPLSALAVTDGGGSQEKGGGSANSARGGAPLPRAARQISPEEKRKKQRAAGLPPHAHLSMLPVSVGGERKRGCSGSDSGREEGVVIAHSSPEGSLTHDVSRILDQCMVWAAFPCVYQLDVRTPYFSLIFEH